MKSFIFVAVAIIIAIINSASAQTVASNEETKSNTSSSVNASVNVTVISEVVYCNTNPKGENITVQYVLIDGVEFYIFKDVTSVVFLTNTGEDNQKAHWFSNKVEVKKLQKITKKEKSNCSFNALSPKGHYIFGNNERPF